MQTDRDIAISQPEQIYRVARHGLLPRGLWSLYYVRVRDGDFRFGGFAIPPRALPMPLRFFVNEIEASVTPYAEEDPTTPLIAARLGLPGSLDSYAFSATIPLAQLNGARTLRVEFRPGAAHEIAPYQDWHVPLETGLQAETKQRVRVAAIADAALFEATGLSAAETIRRALHEYFERDYVDCAAILDWGCGCGRVARFITEEAPDKLVGIDIDPDNIAWCARNIPHAQFHPIGLNPPTALASQAFDLVYGISVFTHLAEADQDLWLSELQRLTRPGAAVLMSIHGEIAFCRSDGDFHRFLDLQERGFQTYGVCNDLDEVVPEAKAMAYYKNVFHSRRYIYERWSRFFEIIDVIDATFSGHQDLVIMRRR
jgi:SAM-dependent methyltransferase